MSNHTLEMIIIMILSSLLSTMNIWVDKLDHMRLSLNDLYMTMLMTGWMLFFMGIYYGEVTNITIGISLVITSIYLIRTQSFIGERQYLSGMIPHHSMAIHMSKKLLEKGSLEPLLKNIVDTQNKEIEYMKKTIL